MHFLTLLFVFSFLAMTAAQWNNGFWWPAPQQQQSFNWFGNGGQQSDDKGNTWHGSDNAKLMLFAKSSWP